MGWWWCALLVVFSGVVWLSGSGNGKEIWHCGMVVDLSPWYIMVMWRCGFCECVNGGDAVWDGRVECCLSMVLEQRCIILTWRGLVLCKFTYILWLRAVVSWDGGDGTGEGRLAVTFQSDTLN